MAYVLYKGKKMPKWIFDQGSAARARKVYYSNSLKEAARAFCIDCVGTAIEARKCECDYCPLWPYRPGVKRGKPPVGVPSEEELETISEEMEAAKRAGKDPLSIAEVWTLSKEKALKNAGKKKRTRVRL